MLFYSHSNDICVASSEISVFDKLIEGRRISGQRWFLESEIEIYSGIKSLVCINVLNLIGKHFFCFEPKCIQTINYIQ